MTERIDADYYLKRLHEGKMSYGGKVSGWKLLWIKLRGSRHVEYLDDINMVVFHCYKNVIYLTYFGRKK
jgi:hypothetical protein